MLRLVVAARYLVLVPFFLAAWDAKLYGEWLTLSSFPLALVVFNLGMGSAAATAFVLRYAAGDVAGAARAFRAGILLINLAILGAVGVGAAVLVTLHQFGALRHLSVSETTAITVISLLILSALVGFFRQLNECWFRAARLVHRAMYYDAFVMAARIISVIGLLLAGKDMIWVAASDLVITIGAALWMRFQGRRLLPEVQPHSVRVDRADLRGFFAKGLAFVMTPASHAIEVQGAVFIARFALGPEAVAVVGTLRNLSNALVQIYAAVNTIFAPELQLSIGKGRLEEARRIFRFGVGLTFVLGVVGVTLLAVLGPSIYHVWTGGNLRPPRGAWSVLLAAVFVAALWWAAAAAFLASNRPEGFGLIGLIASVVAIAASAALVGPFGINGIFAGTLVMNAIIGAYVLPGACKLLGQPFWRLPMDIVQMRREAGELLRNRLTRRTAGRHAGLTI